MSFFDPSGLAISLPGEELAELDLPGSVINPDVVLACALSLEFRAALVLILQACRQRHVPVQIVARPEIFTHGNAQHWLRQRLGAISQHLCITDGTSIKPIAGCHTHIFLYRLNRHANFIALPRLAARAPELVACVESQVNTALALDLGDHLFVPECCYLTQSVALPRPEPRLLPFFLNMHSAEDTANRIEHRGDLRDEQLPKYLESIYVPLTQTAMQDGSFARAVAEMIVQAFFRPSTLLVLRLPSVDDGHRPLVTQIQTILPSLRNTRVTIPHGCPPNVVLATGDLTEDASLLAARPWTMMFHESFDFWRYTEAFYRQAQRVVVMATPDPANLGAFLPLDVVPLFGPRAVRIWLRRSARA